MGIRGVAILRPDHDILNGQIRDHAADPSLPYLASGQCPYLVVIPGLGWGISRRIIQPVIADSASSRYLGRQLIGRCAVGIFRHSAGEWASGIAGEVDEQGRPVRILQVYIRVSEERIRRALICWGS